MVKGFVKSNNELRIKIVKEINANGYLVYLSILAHKISDGDKCYPSIQVVADECSCSVSQVKRYIKTLSDKGFIIVNSGCKGQANNYWFPLEDDFEHTEMSKKATRRKGTKTKGEFDYTVQENTTATVEYKQVQTDTNTEPEIIETTIEKESKQDIDKILYNHLRNTYDSSLNDSYFKAMFKEYDLPILLDKFLNVTGNQLGKKELQDDFKYIQSTLSSGINENWFITLLREFNEDIKGQFINDVKAIKGDKEKLTNALEDRVLRRELKEVYYKYALCDYRLNNACNS